jgi:hypothetical protein
MVVNSFGSRSRTEDRPSSGLVISLTRYPSGFIKSLLSICSLSKIHCASDSNGSIAIWGKSYCALTPGLAWGCINYLMFRLLLYRCWCYRFTKLFSWVWPAWTIFISSSLLSNMSIWTDVFSKTQLAKSILLPKLNSCLDSYLSSFPDNKISIWLILATSFTGLNNLFVSWGAIDSGSVLFIYGGLVARGAIHFLLRGVLKWFSFQSVIHFLLRRVQKSFSFQRCHTLSFEARSKLVQICCFVLAASFPEVPSTYFEKGSNVVQKRSLKRHAWHEELQGNSRTLGLTKTKICSCSNGQTPSTSF